MSLIIDQLLPEPLAERDTSASDIWKKTVTFQADQFYQIQAPSGKGKSTFVHILYGLRRDYTGRLQWFGKNFTSKTGSAWYDLRKNSVSIVFQDLRLFPALTAYENLMVRHHLNSAVSETKVKEMMERAGVSALANKRADTLSYGERQRFAVIRSLIPPFQFLLLDEPVSHLDEANRKAVGALIVEVAKARGAGVIVAGLDQDQLFPYDQTLML